MAWREIRFAVGRDQAQRLSDALLDAGALSVTLEDAEGKAFDENEASFDEASNGELLSGEPGAEARLWTNCMLCALFDANVDAKASTAAVLAQHNITLPETYHQREVAEQDWVRATQTQFQPIMLTPRIWVVPSWHEVPDPRAINLRIDPGLAFGTGSHATTRLCAQWLDRHLHAGCSVLDYGCGSGILAIIAAKLGAGAVTGIDIDPVAIATAMQNARDNQADAIRWHEADIVPDARFDIVVANILANPLRVLAPMLTELTAVGGALVLSGILREQAKELIACYAPAMALTISGEEDGWVCLSGRRMGQ